MPADRELNRLRWQCRRGMRELDAVLLRFLDGRYGSASPAEQVAFRRLLSLPDPEILTLLTARGAADDPGVDGLVRSLVGQRLS